MSGHKAQSESIAESVGEWMGQEGMTDATMISSSIDALRHAVLASTESADAQAAGALAQVAATIAQTEQLRMGNLIAYVGMIETQFPDAKTDPKPWDWSSYEDSNARREAAQVLIRKGLGL